MLCIHMDITDAGSRHVTPPELVTPARASDRVYAELRDEILDWRLPPGTVLTEVEQSLRLGVSRTPVREALARLAAEGIVAPSSGRGLVVTTVSTENIGELFELREALEQQAARSAALRHDPAVFRAIRQEFVGAPELVDGIDPSRHAYYDLVRRFDDALDLATGNPYLRSALATMRTHVARIRRLSRENPERLIAAAAEHLAIVDAILDRDPELAAMATHLHLHSSRKALLASVGQPTDHNPLITTPEGSA